LHYRNVQTEPGAQITCQLEQRADNRPAKWHM
jgi:hypothetical protein